MAVKTILNFNNTLVIFQNNDCHKIVNNNNSNRLEMVINRGKRFVVNKYFYSFH